MVLGFLSLAISGIAAAPALAVMPVSPPRLSKQMLENFTYHAGLSFPDEDIMRLKNGRLDGEPGQGYLELEQIAWGDLDGDGFEDAAVQIVQNGGGSGFFRTLQVVINRKGKPELLAAYIPLGDRTRINSMTIKQGTIVLDMIVHGDHDGSCCPTVPTIARYRLVRNKLVKQKP